MENIITSKTRKNRVEKPDSQINLANLWAIWYLRAMENKKVPQNQLNIELPSEIATGVYSNLAVISHSPTELVLDFIQVLPGTPKAEVRSRVIITPHHAKRLLLALRENMEKYENNFGEVPVREQEVKLPPNFGGPTGFA